MHLTQLIFMLNMPPDDSNTTAAKVDQAPSPGNLHFLHCSRTSYSVAVSKECIEKRLAYWLVKSSLHVTLHS